MKIQKDMNRYKFQMGAELPPEMMQQMQGMPMEQEIPMEQGIPVEQGNGEASFAQQLMAIEQEIDKIQKEMKKLEKRDDRLAQNEYKRLEQQLMQLEQQKEMLRQQVEATRQQLEAQEQMQGEEYLDPNAQYEMSPEELDALEGQYQDVPMEEQINPEEMQMMQYGGKMQTGKKILNWLGQIPVSETIGGQLSEVNMKNLEKDLAEGKISPKEYNARVDNGLAANLIANSMSVLPEAAVIDSDLLAYLTAIPTLGGAYLHDRATYTRDGKTPKDSPFHWYFGGKEEYEKEMKEIENAKKNTSVKKSFGGKMQGGRSLIGKERGLFDYNIDNGEIPEDLDDWNNRKLTPISNSIKRTIPERKLSFNPYLDGYLTSINYYGEPEEPIIEIEDTSNGYRLPDYNSQFQKDIADSLYKDKVVPVLRQQKKDNFKKGTQKVKDYFGDRPLSDYAQLAIAAAGILDDRARLNNEIARNMTLTDNPYPRIINNINEYSEGVKQAINREYTQRSNRLRNDIRRAESSVQPRSVFGRSANLMAMQDAYNENQNKLDADYQTKLAANESDRSKQYNAAFENFAGTERANKIYNMNKLTNALEKDDKITANKYSLAQTELNRWGEIEQDRRDRNFLETQYLDNLYNNYYVNLLSAGIPNNQAIDIVDKLRQKNTKKSTKKSK